MDVSNDIAEMKVGHRKTCVSISAFEIVVLGRKLVVPQDWRYSLSCLRL